MNTCDPQLELFHLCHRTFAPEFSLNKFFEFEYFGQYSQIDPELKIFKIA